MLHIVKLLIFTVEQILKLDNLKRHLLTACTHLNFTILDDWATKILQNRIQVLCPNDNALSTCKCLDDQHSILDGCQHFLYRRYFIHNIEMIAFIITSVKSCSKLLMNINQNFQSLSVCFKSPCQSRCLCFNLSFSGQNHEILNFSLVNVNLASVEIENIQYWWDLLFLSWLRNFLLHFVNLIIFLAYLLIHSWFSQFISLIHHFPTE